MKITTLRKQNPQRIGKYQPAAPASSSTPSADVVELKGGEPKSPSLLTKATRAVTRPIVNFAKRTVGDVAATTAAAGLVTAATLGAVAVAGPVGLLVPVGAGVLGGLAGGKAAAESFVRPKDGRFIGMSTGAALAGFGMAGALGATAATGLPIAAAACTAAGVAGGIGLSMAVGAIYGVGNTLMTQSLEAMGVMKKSG